MSRMTWRGGSTPPETGSHASLPPEPFLPPVALVRCPEGLVEGYVERLTETGALIQSLGGMPAVGDECEVTLDFRCERVAGRGRVLRANLEDRLFTLELTQVARSGRLLLAALLLDQDRLGPAPLDPQEAVLRDDEAEPGSDEAEGRAALSSES